jgi:hypothetical protein
MVIRLLSFKINGSDYCWKILLGIEIEAEGFSHKHPLKVWLRAQSLPNLFKSIRANFFKKFYKVDGQCHGYPTFIINGSDYRWQILLRI